MRAWDCRLGVALTAITAIAAACTSPTEVTPDAPPSANCIAADEHSDLAWIQERIFTPTCAAFTACHKDVTSPAGGLRLTAGLSRDALVAKPSSVVPTMSLVTPGSSAESYLMIALGSMDGPLPDEGTMPPNNPLLCAQQRDAIARWIDEGALP